MFLACLAPLAQPQQAAAPASQPKVKVNMLNVCSPSAEEKQEMSAALAHVPGKPSFAPDFEIDRGQSTLGDTPGFLQAGADTKIAHDFALATWVRMRRELPAPAMFSTVQYSFSVDSKMMVETLVFKVRDPKDLMQLAIEDTAASVTSPAAMLSMNTPATHIKLERFGKASVALARCSGSEGSPAPDQGAFEPIFRDASAIVSKYRKLLGAGQTVPAELARTETHVRARLKTQSQTSNKAPSEKAAKSTTEQ
ncbi:MAG: hypothetical protein M3O09_09390 [Acidobacteriota bacterium]|nr:hypothetical protein [Acidobacteriota bacterium]